MQLLEATTLETYEAEVAKFMRRRRTEMPDGWRKVSLVFHRTGNSILCEILVDAREDGDFWRARVGAGISHKSRRCHACGIPGDKWDEKTGKIIALWRALDDANETVRIW